MDPKETFNLPMVSDLKEYIKILVDTPKAFIFGFFDHNKVGNLIDKTIKVI